MAENNYRPRDYDREESSRSQNDRARSRSRSPRRSRYDSDRSVSRDRHRDRDDYRSDRRTRSPNGYGGRGGSRSYDDRRDPVASRKENSQQDRRVFVGNLSYDVKWQNLKDHMAKAGEVLFADVLQLPNGMSKGCGIVEFATSDGAQSAISTLSNTNLLGREIFIREDRESEPRFGSGPAPGAARGGFGGGSSYGGGRPQMGGGGGGGGKQLYVGNLPYTVAWQELKDFFRQSATRGQIIRADVQLGYDGRSKGSGIVVYESGDDAQDAIHQFNGYNWDGRNIEVREDRFAGGSGGAGGFGGRGGFQGGRGSFGGAYGGRGGFQGSRGGFSGGYGGHDSGPPAPAAPNPFTDDATSNGEPSNIIYVRNLPWSTSDEDLVELFTTIGKVERAEIQYEAGGRSKGSGVVEFSNQTDAETSIQKFSGYQYGGRPLGLSYVRYMAAGGESMAMAMDQDQIM